jgi:hypothetical protein
VSTVVSNVKEDHEKLEPNIATWVKQFGGVNKPKN